MGPLLLVLLALPGGLAAQQFERRAISGEVRFDARATLGDFSGRSRSIAGAIRTGGGLEQARGWVEVPVRSLRTGNPSRDREMREVLAGEGHTVIRFDLTDVVAGMPDGDSIPVTLRGGFSLHGVTRSHAITGWLWRRPSGATRFRGQTVLQLSEFGLRRPGRMFGLLRMRDGVTVWIDLTVSG
jgi:polyisoprenoid-binding protein YceI